MTPLSDTATREMLVLVSKRIYFSFFMLPEFHKTITFVRRSQASPVCPSVKNSSEYKYGKSMG
jgi:hypothetical protein